MPGVTAPFLDQDSDLLSRSAPDGLALLDFSLKHRSCNPPYLAACGRPAAEVLGQSVEEAWRSPALAAQVQALAGRCRSESPSTYRGRFELGEAGVRCLDLRCAPAAAPLAGEPVFVLVVREVEQEPLALEEAEARERLLISSSQLSKVGGWQLEAETMELRWTDETYRLLGVPLDQPPVLDEGVEFFYPEDRPALRAALKQALEEGEPYDLELRIVRPDGATRWTRSICEPILERGKVVRLIGSFQDISARKEAQLQANELKAIQRTHKLQALGRFSAGVAHDFNNLLTVILGAASELDLQAGPNALCQERIVAAAQRGAALTKQLLAMGRVSLQQLQTVDLEQSVDEAEGLLRRVVEESVEFVRERGEGPLLLQADPAQLQQVIMNLVLNARDAMPEGGRVTLSTRRELVAGGGPEKQPRGEYAVLAVRDSGTGIEPEALARIFEPFFTTKETGKGTGLGLAIVHGIVEQSRGWIQVASEPGAGSCFEVFLPVAPKSSVLPLPAVPEECTASSERGTGTLLLVEDEDLIREMLTEVLEAKGYEVLAASRPSEALKHWEERRGDIRLLLSDVVMPEYNGDQLADRLRESEPNLRVLFLSGYAADPAFSERLQKPRTALLGKPFRPQELLGAIEGLLSS